VLRVQERAAADGVNWWIWRLVQSPDVPDGLHLIRRFWSFSDTLDAHQAQDALDAMRKIQIDHDKAEAKRNARRPRKPPRR